MKCFTQEIHSCATGNENLKTRKYATNEFVIAKVHSENPPNTKIDFHSISLQILVSLPYRSHIHTLP